MQRVLMGLGVASVVIGILSIITAITLFASMGVILALDISPEADPGVHEELYSLLESYNAETGASVDIGLLVSMLLRVSSYSALVGASLLVCGAYAIFCSRRNGRLLRLTKLSTVGIAAASVGIIWTPWDMVGFGWFAPLLVALGLQLGMQLVSSRLRKEATGEVAEELAYEEARKHMTREERLADETRLGFLRFIQVAYLINMVIMVTSLIFASRNEIAYDFNTLFDMLNLIFVGVSFYMIWRRLRIARQWIIGISIVKIVLNTIHILVVNGLNGINIAVIAISSLWDIIVLIYFLRSDRVRLIMTNELSLDVDTDESDDLVIDRRSFAFWRNMLLYYCVFSTLGHWMEAGFCYLVSLGLFQGDIDFNNTMLFRDWLYPFPMHGFAVVMIALILYPLKEWLRKRFNGIVTLFLSFLVNMLFCTGIEFGGGMMFNRNLQLWNYTDIPFNFMGQVCLQNAIGFGLAATFIVYLVYPVIERYVARIPKDVMNTVCVGIFTFYAILMALYVIDLSPEAAAANATIIPTFANTYIKPLMML